MCVEDEARTPGSKGGVRCCWMRSGRNAPSEVRLRVSNQRENCSLYGSTEKVSTRRRRESAILAPSSATIFPIYQGTW